MHSAEREKLILDLLAKRRFISFRELEKRIDASAATLRRDLERMASGGKLERVHGGAKSSSAQEQDGGSPVALSGVPFHENVNRHAREKAAIGRAAAALCEQGSAVMIDGGSTTLQMCRHLNGLELQVLTNSLHIVSALLPQPRTRILVPGGSVFREQNIILSPVGENAMPRFHAPRLFMGAAAVGEHGLMQADVVLVAAERRLIERAEEVIVLVDSSKFRGSSGAVVCSLEEIDIIVTDSGIDAAVVGILESFGVHIIVVDVD